MNVESVLDAVVERVPEPKKLSRTSELLPHNSTENEPDAKKALIFDSQYDSYK
jgi:translation elongation factor EF-4